MLAEVKCEDSTAGAVQGWENQINHINIFYFELR